MQNNLMQAQADLMTRRPKHNSQPQPLAGMVEKALTAVPLPDDTPTAYNGAEPPRLGDLDLSWHPLVATAVGAARNWQQRRRAQIAAGQKPTASLVLLSTPVPGDIDRTGYGCGKTHIARACLWSISYIVDGLAIAPAGKFFMAGDIINRLDGETHASNEISGAKIVVIDDVGAEGLIPYIRQDEKTQAAEREARYFKLVDYCYSAGVSLIITGNLSLDALADRIGGRAWSRLLQMAPAGCMVNLSGVPDYRRRAGGR